MPKLILTQQPPQKPKLYWTGKSPYWSDDEADKVVFDSKQEATDAWELLRDKQSILGFDPKNLLSIEPYDVVDFRLTRKQAQALEEELASLYGYHWNDQTIHAHDCGSKVLDVIQSQM